MNKTELINAMAEKSGLKKSVSENVLNAFLETVTETLAKKEKIQLIGFGTFETGKRAEREGKNPQTGEKIIIPAATTVRFKSGKSLKDMLNQ